MGEPKSFCTPLRWTWVIVCALALLAGALAQAPQNVPPKPPPPGVPGEEASRQAERKERHITPAEAQQLFRSVDTILKYDSDVTGLPIHHPVKRALASRDQIEQYVRKQLDDDKDAKRLRRSEAVLKKFGLLPRNYDLESLLVSVLREQVAGYYDPKDQTMYLLDWLEPDAQKGVIAHELTHALQDQTIHLEKWLKDEDIGDASTKDLDKRDQKGQEISQDEVGSARQAVIEGQATAVFLDYFLQPTGETLQTHPEIVHAFQQSMMDSGNTPVFRDAPLYMKEALAFPYKYGLSFEEQLLLDGGAHRAFESVLKDPPRTTRQILEPKTYLAGEKIPPMKLPAMRPLLGDKYDRFDIDSVGEFDVYVILEQFANERTAERLSKDWRGGEYYAARRLDYQPAGSTGQPPSPPTNEAGAGHENRAPAVSPDSLALLYISRWATPDAAQKFADAYTAALPKRYSDVRKEPLAPNPQNLTERTAAHTRWMTSDGPVYVEPWGQMVLIMESFDDATAGRIREAFLTDEEPGISVPQPQIGGAGSTQPATSPSAAQ